MKERRKTLGPKFFLSVFAVLSLFISVLSTSNAYAAVPQNVSFSPTSGGTGTSVTITGKNFATPATVTFGGTSATNVTFISTTQILAVVGTGSTGKVSVTTSGGTGISAADFTYITDVTSPAFTMIASNTTVTVTLTGGTYKAGTVAASDFTFGGANAARLALGTFTRTSDTIVTITALTSISGAADNTVLVKAATQATQATSVAAVASPIGDVTSPEFTMIASNTTVTVTLTGGTYKAGTVAASDFTFGGANAARLALGTFTRTSDTIVTITALTSISGAANNTVLVKAATQATQTVSVAAVASPIVDVTSPAFTTHLGNTTVTVTLTGGTYKAGTVAASDFTFSGTDAGVIAASGIFTRTSDTIVTITGLSGLLAGGANNTVLVKAATQATQATSVAAVASPSVSLAPSSITITFGGTAGAATATSHGFTATGFTILKTSDSTAVTGIDIDSSGAITVANTTVVGVYDMTVSATDGVTTATQTIAVTVNAVASTYTITYNPNGGSVSPSSAIFTVGGSALTLPAPSYSGYAFNGWFDAASGGTFIGAASASYSPSGAITLYAQWTAIYTVIYDEDGASGGSVPVDGSSPYLNGATVTVLGNTGPLVKTGNTFAGWNTALDGSGTSYAPTATFAIAANMVFYAQWTLVGSYTVTYSGNGSTGGTVPVDVFSPYANGTTVTVHSNSGSLVKTGYAFANWNTAANGSETSYAPSNTFAIGADTILYAQWAPVGSRTVAYNGNGSTGGTVPNDVSSPYLSGGTVTVLGNSRLLVKTGYIFAHWNTAANGSGTSYSGGNTFNIGIDTILYAQWTITYSVFYDEDGATGGTVPVDGSSPYLNGATVTVLGNTGPLVKTGNTFAGWNTALDGSGTSYAPTATFAIVANMFLYSQWTATVTYDANGATDGTAPVDAFSPYLDGVTVTVLGNTGTLVKTGSTFDHWNTAANGSGTSYSPGNTFNIGADTILYAQWIIVTPPIATIETPVTELVRADATGDTVVDATILGIGGIPFVVSVTIPAGAISRDITITIAPAATPAEISAGFIIIRVTATDSSGTSVTRFDKPLIINLGHVNAGASVVFSQDEIAWTLIQLLSGTTLPDGMQEGYYVAVDGDTIILTRHLIYFGVKTPQVGLRVLSSANILKVGESATLTAIGGSGSGVIGYVAITPSICSVSDAGLVRALTAGVCIVEATKSGAATYMNVLSLPLNLTIKRVLSVPAPSPTPGTVNGGVLSKTGSPWYNLLALSIGLILLGGVSLVRRKRRS